jgi:hypothetical protein
MKKNQRLSLADFKMNKLENKNEIDKLLGGLAAACHETCNPMAEPYEFIDFIDHTEDGKGIDHDILVAKYKELIER